MAQKERERDCHLGNKKSRNCQSKGLMRFVVKLTILYTIKQYKICMCSKDTYGPKEIEREEKF